MFYNLEHNYLLILNLKMGIFNQAAHVSDKHFLYSDIK